MHMVGAALAAVSAASQIATAQIISGTVRDRVSDLPIAGAAVTLLGTERASTARALTSAAGTFRLPLAGATSLRIVRIGYTPYEAPLRAAGLANLDIARTPLGARLRPITVRANPICPRRSDQAVALATRSAATDGLLAAVLANAATTATDTVTQISFDRLLDGAGERIVRQSTRRVQTENVSPIRAGGSAESFARDGYVQQRATGLVYYAPDPEVLLDTAFAATHCLSIRTDSRRRPGQIGRGTTTESCTRITYGPGSIAGKTKRAAYRKLLETDVKAFNELVGTKMKVVM